MEGAAEEGMNSNKIQLLTNATKAKNKVSKTKRFIVSITVLPT
jgi:hypothetical protein